MIAGGTSVQNVKLRFYVGGMNNGKINSSKKEYQTAPNSHDFVRRNERSDS